MGETTRGIKRIDSDKNASYKQWLKLKTAHGRKKEGRVLLESRKLVAEALDVGKTMDVLIVEEGKENALEAMLAYCRIFTVNGNANLPPQVVLASSLFRHLSAMEHPDGILAVLCMNETDAMPSMKSGRWLLLDHLQDPGNVGTLLRSAEAFGFTHIVSLASADFASEKVLRASMGAALRLHLYHADEGSVRDWKKRGTIPWIGADLEGQAIGAFAFPNDFVLVIGNEGRGLSSEVADAMDAFVTIPMQGGGESLNAAVSGSILMAWAALQPSENLHSNPQ